MPLSLSLPFQVSYDETNGSDHLQDNKNQLRLSATSPAEVTTTDQVYSTDSADKNEGEVNILSLPLSHSISV